MTTPLSDTALALLVERCQKERAQFQQANTLPSPACLEIFRRAFTSTADQQAAWSAIHTLFERMMYKWISVQSQVEPEDVIQDAFLAFVRAAPQKPDLLNHDSLGPLVEYMRRCTKSALLQMVRKHRVITPPVSLDVYFDSLEQPDDMVQTALREDLKKRLDELLESAEDRLVFELRFECNIKPQAIFANHPELFPTYQAVATVVQRLTRRLRKDPVLQNLYGMRQKPEDSVFLKMSILEDEAGNAKDSGVDIPCPYDEVVLLDYITGLATPTLVAAIEQSVACHQTARTLAGELGQLLQVGQRLHCPDIETLIDYQERRLTGAAHLVVHRHMQQCPLCQKEWQMLTALDAVALESPMGVVRRMVEALFQAPLTLAVRGDWLHYQTPNLVLNIGVRQSTGKGRTWTLRAQLRTQEGNLITERVEQALLRRLDEPAQAPVVATLIAGEPSLTFRELATGEYALHVMTADEEIVIRKIVVGSAG